MIDRAVALYGTTQPVPERVELRAGPVSAILEDGALRWIRLGGVEVLRGIAFLVRDRNWGTANPKISGLKIDQKTDSFTVGFSALCRTDDGELPFAAEIVGKPDGSLHFTGTATPAKDFLTCRTGFVILHPLDRVVGCPLEVTHVDGSKRRARFPAFVDPEQCFFDIRALSHEAVPGVWATCRMEGDAWEMEDHRNWLDASFKTYVRPLALPYPYTIEGGSKVTQSVTLTFSGSLPKPAKASASAPVEVTVGGLSGTRMPLIGLRAPLQWMDEAQAAVDLVGHAGVQLLSGRIDPREGHGAKELQRLGALAAALGAGLALEIVVPCRRDPAEELQEVAGQIKEARLRPESIVVAPAEDRVRLGPGAPPPSLSLLGEVYRAARAALPDATIGGGSFGFFTELNRNWPPIGLIDYITNIICSVVHASDDRAMMENLHSYQHVIATVRAFAGDKPYRLIASSIGLDVNPYGPATPNPDNERITMVRMDPRHRGLFGAAWTLAMIGELARGGVAAVSPAAPVGEFGIAHRKLSYAQPWFDGLGRAAVYPVYHVVAAAAQAAGKPCLEALSSDRTRLLTASWREADGGTSLWLANLQDMPQRVALRGLAGTLRVASLDESTFEAAAVDPDFLAKTAASQGAHEIELGAYGVARVQAGA
jgi:hypothetical protein